MHGTILVLNVNEYHLLLPFGISSELKVSFEHRVLLGAVVGEDILVVLGVVEDALERLAADGPGGDARLLEHPLDDAVLGPRIVRVVDFVVGVLVSKSRRTGIKIVMPLT